MSNKKNTIERRCDEIYAFITAYIAQNGYSPTFREIGDAVGIRSTSTISKYIHLLVEDGRISIDESKPRTISAATGEIIETEHKRLCLVLSDGGKIYMDCNLQKPKAAPVTLTFDGVLDAKEMKGRIGRIVRCDASYE